MIPHWGWRSVLFLGGFVPLVLAVVLLFVLPESVRHMVANRQPVERIRRVLQRISAVADEATSFVLTETSPAVRANNGAAVVLSRPYVAGSLMLWLAYFMGLVIFYALINWMPILLKDVGIEAPNAALLTALFPLGGVGAVFFGWLMDRFNGNTVIAIGFALTAAAVFAIGHANGNIAVLIIAVFVAGTLMKTAQSSLPALAADFYPTQGGATGVAWMLGLGRFGGIAGSFLVADLTRRGAGFSDIFSVVAIPGVIAAVALVVKQLARPEARLVRGVDRGEVLSH
jgi:AAHS family 4-hydroxybenzoate transporter-like MFS transporter